MTDDGMPEAGLLLGDGDERPRQPRMVRQREVPDRGPVLLQEPTAIDLVLGGVGEYGDAPPDRRVRPRGSVGLAAITAPSACRAYAIESSGWISRWL